MWSYYGSKANIVKLYPKPRHSKIIEPFAGSARYALEYFDRDVLLVDKYGVIVKIWQWLQLCSKEDILRLPRQILPGQTLNDFKFDCEEEKWLMGFLIKKGDERPSITPSPRITTHRPNHINYSIKRIAANLFKIKHWKIMQGSYENIENEIATWFIDPPYQFGGHCYIENNKKINFPELGEWCKNRGGQIIVCETTKANWLPFRAMVRQTGNSGFQKEAIWCNHSSEFDIEQGMLF